MKSLIVIDVQNDFLYGGALAVPDGDSVIEVINRIMPRFDLVVATQDWHPGNHGSFASANAGKNPFETGFLGEVEQVFWPDHCVQGTFGAQLSHRLNQNPIEAIFRKGTNPLIDSYSAFFDNARKKATGLEAYLKGLKVNELYVVGLAGDYCVGFTALDALELGIQTILIEDATRPINPIGYSETKNKIIQMGGRILLSSQLI